MADSLQQLVSTLRDALKILKERSEPLGIQLTKAELEAKVVGRYKMTAGWKFELFGIDTSAGHKRTHTQVLSLELLPSPPTGNLASDESHELADEIVALAKEVEKISTDVAQDFTISTFGVSFAIEVERSGGVKVVAGAGGASGDAHQIKLTFRKKVA